MTKDWTLAEALPLLMEIERIAPSCGCHVALTGSVLYGNGEAKKDLDILFYRIRQWDEIWEEDLFFKLAGLGIEHKSGFGWCHKATFQGKSIDIFFPEEKEGEYPCATSLKK